jgi:hypothetical protein
MHFAAGQGSGVSGTDRKGGATGHYSTKTTLPTGTYRCVLRFDHGICLQKVESKSDDVILLPDPVAETLIKEAQRFWLAADDFRKLGVLHKRGFLLMGPSGNGKSSIIGQISAYLLWKLDGLVLLVDDPAKADLALAKVRQAEPDRPVLAIVEDIEAMLDDGQEECLLSLLDGRTQIDHVLFIATTNYPERLDQRLLGRPSRFDRVEAIRAPSSNVRQAYLEKRIPELCATELERWVELSEGFSLAHLKELILAVRCLGADLSETAERLKAGLKQKPTSENFYPLPSGFRLGR